MDQYVDCPKCSASNPRKVTFTWWGGLVGPSMFTHVQCQRCNETYNGKTGKSNFVPITIYVIVSFVVVSALMIGVLVMSNMK